MGRISYPRPGTQPSRGIDYSWKQKHLHVMAPVAQLRTPQISINQEDCSGTLII